MGSLPITLRRVIKLFGEPVRLPGWLALALGAYAFVPDTQARIEFWTKLLGQPVIAGYLASPWTGIALVAIGFVYLWFCRDVVHVHHLPLNAETKPTATIGLQVIRAQPQRDTKLRSALSFVVRRDWDGTTLFQDISGSISAAGAALKQFEQLARDGKLATWGKVSSGSVYDPIPSDYWSNHTVEYLSLFKEEARVERDSTLPPHYVDLMVSKVQAEDWAGNRI